MNPTPWDDPNSPRDPIAPLFRATQPPEPTPERWADTLARIEAALPAQPRPRYRPRLWRLTGGGLALLGAVAAGLCALLLTRPAGVPQPSNPAARSRVAEDSFPVLAEDEVTIISVSPETGEEMHLVVGAPPLPGGQPLALAGPDDVTVEKIEYDQGMNTRYRADGASAPMIVTEDRSGR